MMSHVWGADVRQIRAAAVNVRACIPNGSERSVHAL